MKSQLLTKLYRQVEDNFAKFPLAKKPEDIIPGEGLSTARIMFIGEAPGYHETVERRPFVGRSGKFFRKTLTQEAHILEKNVYISNIVKVRPPENRDPTPEEIEAFRVILDKEISIIEPELIVTLGRFSMAKFLKDVFISKVHGRLHRAKLIFNKTEKTLFILPMYHPAAGLRNGKVRQSFIDDFKKIPKILNWISDQEKIKDLKNSVVEHLF